MTKESPAQADISLRFEHATKQRYYHILLTQDMFGDWVITKAWGGINKAAGRITHLACSSHEEAKKLINKLIKMRETRGYILCLHQ